MIQKARIAVVLTSEPSDGGKFTYSLSIVDALGLFDRRKFELLAFATNPAQWNSVLSPSFSTTVIRKTFRARVARRIILALPRGHEVWRVFGRRLDPIHRVLIATRPDLVFYPGNDALAHECAVPSAIPIHDLMHRYENRFPEVSKNRLFQLREKHYREVCKQARCILVDSETGRQHVLESYNTESSKIHVLPYVAPRLPESTSGRQAILRLGISRGFVFYPAQFWKHKNHEVIVRALALLKEQGNVFRAVFVGSDKNSRRDVLSLTESLGVRDQITILDFVSQEELAALYRLAGALVMPTFFGPTNIPPLEAFQMGCPVIVSDIYGMREQLGDVAAYVDPNNPKELARMILRILKNKKLRRALIGRGKRRARKWNQESFGKRLEVIVNNVLGLKP